MKRLSDERPPRWRDWGEILFDALVIVVLLLLFLGIFAMLGPGVVA